MFRKITSLLALSIIMLLLFNSGGRADDNQGNDEQENQGDDAHENNKEKKDRGKRCENNIRIKSHDDLQFGEFVVTGPGSVKVDANGIPSASGGIYFLGGNTSNARFKVEGCSGYQYNISLPDSAWLRSKSSYDKMRLDSFISQPASIGQLNAYGHQYLQVGGILHANLGQLAGNYRGQFLIEVNYE